MMSPSEAGVKDLGFVNKKLSLGLMSPVIPFASAAGLGHLSGRKGTDDNFGYYFGSFLWCSHTDFG